MKGNPVVETELTLTKSHLEHILMLVTRVRDPILKKIFWRLLLPAGTVNYSQHVGKLVLDVLLRHGANGVRRQGDTEAEEQNPL